MRTLIRAIGLIAVTSIVMLSSFTVPVAAQTTDGDMRPPNIVFILSDDEDVGIHPQMTKTRQLIAEEGVGFDSDLREEREANALALRTERHTFVGYQNGDVELYPSVA